MRFEHRSSYHLLQLVLLSLPKLWSVPSLPKTSEQFSREVWQTVCPPHAVRAPANLHAQQKSPAPILRMWRSLAQSAFVVVSVRLVSWTPG